MPCTIPLWVVLMKSTLTRQQLHQECCSTIAIRTAAALANAESAAYNQSKLVGLESSHCRPVCHDHDIQRNSFRVATMHIPLLLVAYLEVLLGMFGVRGHARAPGGKHNVTNLLQLLADVLCRLITYVREEAPAAAACNNNTFTDSWIHSESSSGSG